MVLSDLATIASKDLLLLWRDRSLPYLILIWLAPFFGLVRSAIITPAVESATSAPVKYLSRPHPNGKQHSKPASKDHEVKDALSHVRVGVMGGSYPELDDSRFDLKAIAESDGISAIEKSDVDILVLLPDAANTGNRVMIVQDPSMVRSATASSMFYNYLQHKKTEDTEQRMTRMPPEQRWVYARVDSDYKDDDSAPMPQPKVFGIGGSLILGAALIAMLVMLVIVEENTLHTLPMILVCAVDRRVIFASKLLLCAVPALSAVVTAAFRTWRALPAVPISPLMLMGILGTAFASGVIFIWIAAVMLVTAGVRARNNIEAAAKVGAPMILIGLMLIVAMSPLMSVTPGLVLVPITNLILCINQLISVSPNWSMCVVALSTSILFAILLTVSGMHTFRCEEGLPGDVAATDPRLNAMFGFFLSAAIFVLFYNFVGLPARIVYPLVGEIVTTAMFLLVGAAVLKKNRLSLGEILWSNVDWKLQMSLLRLALVGGIVVAWISSFGANWNFGIVDGPEVVRLNQLISAQSSSAVAIVLGVVLVLAEEVALRGALVKLLLGNMPGYVIILLFASLGAALHPLANQWFFMAAFSGFLTFVRLRYGSAMPCVVMRLTQHIFVLFHVFS